MRILNPVQYQQSRWFGQAIENIVKVEMLVCRINTRNHTLVAVTAGNLGQFRAVAGGNTDFVVSGKLQQISRTVIIARCIDDDFFDTAGILPQTAGNSVKTNNEADT